MPKEILIAGSDITDQEEFQRIFETTDYRLVFSDKAEEALLRIKLFKPDLIIAGPALSGEGGLEFCESIKSDPEFKTIPVVLVSGILEEITERDRDRVKADGVISTPLNEMEILNLVEGLMERNMLRFAEATGKGGRQGKASEAAVAGLSPETGELLSLDDSGEVTDEEIIELIDVVEEPESRMSIEDFVGAKEEESYGEISFEGFSEKGTEKGEKPYGDLDFLNLDKKDGAAPERAAEPFEKKKEPEKEVRMAPVEKEPVPEDEIFEKIDLEEILAKVEQIQPSIAQESPRKKEAPVVNHAKPAAPVEEEISDERLFSLAEFETALKGEVEKEGPLADIKPFSFEEMKVEPPEEAPVEELAAEEEELTEVAEEEFPEALFEEMLEEEEIKDVEELKEEEAVIQEAVLQEAAIREAMVLEPFIAQPVIPEPVAAQPVVEEPRDFPFEMFDEKPEPVPAVETIAEKPSKEAEDVFKVLEAPLASAEAASPMVKAFEKQLEEVVAKGVQEMIGDFITKILPEMTQNVMNLTAERIEKMVKEIVPDLAEKAIQEEIKRLQKEAKE